MEKQFNYQEMLLDSLARDLAKKHDDRLFNELKKRGIDTSEKYLKEHCRIVVDPYRNYYLYHDDKIILTWNTTINLKYEGTKITAIMG